MICIIISSHSENVNNVNPIGTKASHAVGFCSQKKKYSETALIYINQSGLILSLNEMVHRISKRSGKIRRKVRLTTSSLALLRTGVSMGVSVSTSVRWP